ncbi:MAG: SpoIIE family protein phosphatase [Planctomycetes bacterium]|nr:SpoIIE family protein phosphatase [Planctomycetota bacterium]
MTGPIFDFEDPNPLSPAPRPAPAEEGVPGRLEVCRRCAWPALSRVTELMSGGFLDFDRTLRAIIDTAVAITHAQRGCLLLYTEAEGFKVVVARGLDEKDLSAADFRPSYSVITRVRERGDSVCIPNLYQSPFGQTDSVMQWRILAVMCAPLILKTEAVIAPAEGTPSIEIPTFGGIMGVLYVDSTSPTTDWSDALLDAFQALSDAAVSAIVNARLFEHYRRHQDMRQSLEAARAVQERLLPAAAPPIVGFDVAGWSRACESAGGDYYDFIPLPGERFAVVVGDVAGHGIGAALLMATVRAALHTLIQYVPDPGEVLARLNAVVRRDCAGRYFMTLFLGILDPAARTFTYVNAGHDPPSLYRARTGACTSLAGHGMALGFVGGSRYVAAPPLAFEPGDALLFTTDGMWEARNPEGEELGRESLDRLLVESHADGAGDILEIVRHAALFHIGDVTPEDDMTAVVIKALPPGAPPAERDHLTAGLAALRIDDYDGAIHEFERAVLLGKNPGLARYYIGMACSDKGQWTRARGEFLAAQKLAPDLPNLAAYLKLTAERAGGVLHPPGGPA